MYSFVGPLVTGAGLAKANPEELKHLKDFGICAGIAFQLTDDVLGIFGDEAVTGKSVMSDLQENKRTYLMQQTFARANDEQLAYLREHLGSEHISHEQAEDIRRIIQAVGAVDATHACISEHVERASEALSHVSLDQAAVQSLYDLLAKVSKRDK
jgi:geranylgeranyl pyrophosphate synthase